MVQKPRGREHPLLEAIARRLVMTVTVDTNVYVTTNCKV
jgi:hypothetical protein